jgi:hypothetical protein
MLQQAGPAALLAAFYPPWSVFYKFLNQLHKDISLPTTHPA